MFWGILIALGVVALIAGGLITGVMHVLFAPDHEPNSPAQNVILAVAGVAAFTLMGIIAAEAPGAWWVPIALWCVALSVVRNSCPPSETPAQRHAREDAARKQAEQDSRRAAARKIVAERKRVDSFTKSGLALLERANSAVDDVRATEAARDGWLGDATNLDFAHDLTLISNNLLQARRIDKVVERTKKIPDPSPDDVAMLRDAEKTSKALRAEAKSRVRIFEECLTQAREIDRLLAEERQRQKFDTQRESARRQLAAELYVAEVRPSGRDSDAADAVAARVQAFKELKHIVDEKTLREIEGGGGNSVYDAFVWVRRALPF